MDTSLSTGQTPQNPAQNPSDELAHVNEQMYKKNLQLAEKNKTLSILRQIDQTILSTVTDIQQIAQQVVNLVVDQATYVKFMSIRLFDHKNNTINRLAISQTQAIRQIESDLNILLMSQPISLTQTNNLVAKTVQDRKMYISRSMYDILIPEHTKEQALQIQTALGITSILVYPLIVRDMVIGTMTLGVEEKDASLAANQIDLVERLPSIIAIAIDNSQLFQQLHEANEKLKQLDKLKDEFVSLASHELRTPMTAIKSYLWMALAGKGGPLSEKLQYYINRAYISTDRLIKLVNDMLNVSRIESGRLNVTIVPTDLQTVINDVLTDVKPRADELHIRLIYNPLPNLPKVQADGDKIKEVLINLIGNSFKFTPQNGSITISTALSNNMVVTCVADTGKGIAPADIPKLFHKFGTTGEKNYLQKQTVSGTGLGLYISKSLIEMHGGAIWFASAGEGKGSQFYFTLRPVVGI